LAQEYGLETRFEVRWLRARHWARRYDFSLQALWEALRWGADCLFTRLPQAAAWGSLIGKATIFEVHDLPRGGAARWFRLFLMGKGAKRTVAISTALAADLRVFFPVLCNLKDGFLITAPDGVDLSRYTPLLSVSQARQRLRESGWELPPGFIAGYTGHLYRGRGAELIVSLAAAVPEVHFLIVGGDGEQCRQLEQQFASQAVDNYTLTGLVAPQQVPLFQMASDALLMPYQAQVAASSGGDIARYLSPMKLFEYLASARPILASDLPVLREILNADNAVLLPMQDVSAWANALQELMQNPEQWRRLAEAARRTAEQHSWEERAASILAD
jgi:glycosyltransferase involved in cell wall biosynthesis